MEALAGATVIDNRTEATVRVVEPLIDPEVTSIVLLPVATPVAKPALVIVATVVLDELQVTELVRFWVLESL
jgi:dsRNA-specific ribonuclease